MINCNTKLKIKIWSELLLIIVDRNQNDENDEN